MKPCPGTTANYLCCGYNILNFANNCTMNCTYCILQSYFAEQELTFFCNTDSMLESVRQAIEQDQRPFLRVGTGEFTDSLCLDHITGFSELVVPLFANSRRAVLELKTKTTQIDRLLALDPKDRIVVSWSMNSARITGTEELGAAPLEDRLAAARKCEAAGYRIGFHFDPIILYPGWESDYLKTVDMIFDSIRNPARLAWVSLGCLRYQATLNELIKKRFPQTSFPYAEFAACPDNKLRYPKPIRIEAYRRIYERIAKRHPHAVVYLCMESSSVWKAALDRPFKSDDEVTSLLDNAFRLSA
jgi:spore photoproduct lyase